MEQPANGKQTRSVIANGTAVELQVWQDEYKKWTVFGIVPNHCGVVVSGFNTADDAVEMWLRRLQPATPHSQPAKAATP
jgi:hypothetical protein